MDVVTQSVTEDGLELALHLAGIAADETMVALTSADRVASWWSQEATTDPRVGGTYVFAWPAMEWTLRGRYLAVEDKRLAFTWAWDHEDLPPRTVDITLDDADGGTRLTLRHEAGHKDEAQSYLDGWLHFLAVLESRPWSSA